MGKKIKLNDEATKNLIGFFSLLLKIDNKIKKRNKSRKDLIYILKSIK
jgi:hypothetical protein